MAQVTLTSEFSVLNNWPGFLFEATGSETNFTRSATAFSYRYGSGHEYAGYSVTVTGTGFSYLNGTPTAGRMSSVTVRDADGDIVMTISGLAAGTIASDLQQFQANVFGFNGGSGRSVMAAWNYLLSGNDTITGSTGDDWQGLVGLNTGNNLFNMRGGDDYVNAGAGRDTINGGDGDDMLSYGETHYDIGQTAFRGIVVNVGAGTVLDCWGNTDRFSSIETFEGSRFADRFTGSANRDEFRGLRGADTIIGGGESDRVRYDSDDNFGGLSGIIVNLQVSASGGHIQGTIRDGFGNLDRVTDIERVVGTRFADSFTGSSQNDHFWGGEGRDTFNGMGGFDGIRFDRQFTNANMVGVNVDLSRATGQIINDGFGNTETATNIEWVQGSYRADRLKGNAGGNFLEGGDGADTLIGGAGADSFYWDNSDEIGPIDVITDFVRGADKLEFNAPGFDGMTTTVRLVNGTAATIAQGQFIFNASNHILYWDADGTGSDAAVAVARLQGVNALSVGNFELFD